MRLKISKSYCFILIVCSLWVSACSPSTISLTESVPLSQDTTVQQEKESILPPQPTTLNSIEEAQANVSFQILVPAAETLPDGLQLSSVEWWPLNEQNIEGVTLHYSIEGQELLQITQQTSKIEGSPIGGASYEVVDIRGQLGYLVPDPRLANSLTQNLFWYEEGLFINLIGTLSEDSLHVEDIIAFAEGLN